MWCRSRGGAVSDNFETLLTRLEGARKLHATDQKPGAVAALLAVIEYLSEAGATAGHTLPLKWLAHDLYDKTPGKPIFEAAQWAIAAAAVDVLKLTGISVPQACLRVSRASGGAFTKDQLWDWRKNVRGKKARPDAVKHYHEAHNQMKVALAVHNPDKSQWEKGVIAMIGDTFGSKKE